MESKQVPLTPLQGMESQPVDQFLAELEGKPLVGSKLVRFINSLCGIWSLVGGWYTPTWTPEILKQVQIRDGNFAEVLVAEPPILKSRDHKDFSLRQRQSTKTAKGTKFISLL